MTEAERPIEDRLCACFPAPGYAAGSRRRPCPRRLAGLGKQAPADHRLPHPGLSAGYGAEHPGTHGLTASGAFRRPGTPAERARRVAMNLPEARLHLLANYVSPTPYADLAVDRTAEIGAAMTDFLARYRPTTRTQHGGSVREHGEVDGISYQVQGSGSPLVLLPLSVAPSQWEPLFPQLTKEHCTITLSGPALGMVASLEGRGPYGWISGCGGQAPGYGAPAAGGGRPGGGVWYRGARPLAGPSHGRGESDRWHGHQSVLAPRGDGTG